MKMNFLTLLFLVFILNACSKETFTAPAEGLEVKIVVSSGGCGNVKVIVINKNQTSRDLRGNVCDHSRGNSTAKTDEATFNRLNDYLHELELYDRVYRDCARCLDGVDYVLTINDGTRIIEQSIGFQNKGKGLAAFRKFLDKL